MGNSAYSFTGQGSAERYTNPDPTTIGVGGIPSGSTFDDEGLGDFIDRLLYPYVAPTFSAFTIQGVGAILEVGDSIPASVVFQWGTTSSSNVAANSIDILDVTSSLTLAAGLVNDFSEPVVMPAPVHNTVVANHTFRISADDTHAVEFHRDTTYSWRHRAFYGGSALTVLAESDIEAMTSRFPVTQIAGTYVIATPGYKFICVPDAVGGHINSVKDTSNFDIPMAGPSEGYTLVDGGGFGYALVSVTNTFSVLISYRVYRTLNSLGSAATLVVT